MKKNFWAIAVLNLLLSTGIQAKKENVRRNYLVLVPVSSMNLFDGLQTKLSEMEIGDDDRIVPVVDDRDVSPAIKQRLLAEEADDRRTAVSRQGQNELGVNGVIAHTLTLGAQKGFSVFLTKEESKQLKRIYRDKIKIVPNLTYQLNFSPIEDLQDKPKGSLLTSPFNADDPKGTQVISWGVKATNAPYAWRAPFTGNMGEQTIVCQVDTGGLYWHEDLQDDETETPRIIGGRNFWNNNPNKETNYLGWQDWSGHATHVAGIIGASYNNIGVVGVAPKTRFIISKALSASGKGTTETILGAVYNCMNPLDGKGNPLPKADIMTLSLGMIINSDETKAADNLLHDAIKLAVDNGMKVVVSAGNEGSDVLYAPAYYPEVLSVTNLLFSGRSLDPKSSYAPWVDFTAPGDRIYSSYLPFYDPVTKTETGLYHTLSGTSMSAPMVTGVVVLIDTAAKIIGKGVKPEFLGLRPRGVKIDSLLLSPEKQGQGLIDAYLSLIPELAKPIGPKVIKKKR